jgi:hypothetical protein
MAMQQINLYQASIHRPRQILSLPQLSLVLLVVVGVLSVISAMQWWHMHHLAEQLASARQDQKRLSRDIEILSNRLAQSSNDTELKKTITDKEAELQNKQAVLRALSGKHFGNTRGFADQFVGLARQHVKGVWLTGLYIHAGGDKLNLQGSTYAADLVPQYLQRLAQEPSFQGIEFQTFLMQRAKASAQIDFDLRSTPKEPG